MTGALVSLLSSWQPDGNTNTTKLHVSAPVTLMTRRPLLPAAARLRQVFCCNQRCPSIKSNWKLRKPRSVQFKSDSQKKLPGKKKLESGAQDKMEVKVSFRPGDTKLVLANMQTRVLEDFYKLRRTLTSVGAAASLMRSS